MDVRVMGLISPPFLPPQDTNQPQYDLVRLLEGPDNHLFVVGDTDQVRCDEGGGYMWSRCCRV